MQLGFTTDPDYLTERETRQHHHLVDALNAVEAAILRLSAGGGDHEA